MEQFIFTAPEGQRVGQAIYNFIYWLEDVKQTDTFHLSTEDLLKLYKEWYETLKK